MYLVQRSPNVCAMLARLNKISLLVPTLILSKVIPVSFFSPFINISNDRRRATLSLVAVFPLSLFVTKAAQSKKRERAAVLMKVIRVAQQVRTGVKNI